MDEETLAFAHRVFEMARHGLDDELTPLLDAGLSPNLTNDKGDTLLILSAYHQHAAVVRTLVEHGADLDRANDRGQTALAAAVFRQCEEIVRLLVAAGADPQAGSPSAVAMAEFFSLPQMAALLGS